MDTPPLPLLVLDGLADDVESVGTLRDPGEAEPEGLALVDEQEVVDTLRGLLVDGLVDAWEIRDLRAGLVPAEDPTTDDESLRRYWYRTTPAGVRAWREGRDLIDAWWEAHSGE